MFRSRHRKLSQSPGASPAVNTFDHDPAEPEHSTSFTYLQINAQVVHFSPFQGVPLPDEPRYFSTVERAHLGCWERHRLFSSGSIGPVGQALAFICGCSICSPLGKIHPPAFTFTHGSRYSSSTIVHHWGVASRPLLRFRIGKVSRL